MALRLGLDCFTVHNDATTASPNWITVGRVKDENLTLSKALADVTTRNAAGWRQQVGTLKEASVDLQLLFDDTYSDPDNLLFRNSFLNNGLILLGFFDKDPTLAGTTIEGLYGGWEVTEHSFNRELESAVMIDITLTSREDDAGNGPQWMSITNP